MKILLNGSINEVSNKFVAEQMFKYGGVKVVDENPGTKPPKEIPKKTVTKKSK